MDIPFINIPFKGVANIVNHMEVDYRLLSTGNNTFKIITFHGL